MADFKHLFACLGLLCALLCPGLAVSAETDPAGGNPAGKMAAIVLDAETGAILQGRAIDQPAYPASLTKMMTLYLTFKALSEGDFLAQTPLRASARAARQRPSRLGLRKGDRITVKQAILALVTKSANDAAVVLAEAIAKSETKFAERMNETAKRLGMERTHFRNASGLHDRKQVSTARDLGLLASALFKDFPQYAPYFAVRKFRFRDRVYQNRNAMLDNYPGTDGIKTGYVRASGYNLAASVHRGKNRFIGIVLGEKSPDAREKRMRTLFDRAFRTAAILARSWEIEVGEVARLATAHLVGSTAARHIPDLLHRADFAISTVRNAEGTFYRARFTGIREPLARKACDNLKKNGIVCDIVSPFQAKRVARAGAKS